MTRGTIIKLSLSVVVTIGVIWFGYLIGCRLDQARGQGTAVSLLDMNEHSLLLAKRNSFIRMIGPLGFTFLRQSENGKILPSWIARGYTSWVIGNHIQRPTVRLKYTYSGVIDEATFYISKADLESERYIR